MLKISSRSLPGAELTETKSGYELLGTESGCYMRTSIEFRDTVCLTLDAQILSVALAAAVLLSIGIPGAASASSNHVVSYLRSVANKCKRAYYPPLDVYGTSATVKAEVDKHGRLWNFRVVNVPNYTGTDQPDAFLTASLRAALSHWRATPPRALPPRSEIEMKFDTRINHQIVVTASTNVGGIVYSGSTKK